jgi:hypothetical protein
MGPATYSGAASWNIDLNVQRGVVQHGSHLQLTASPARVHYRDTTVEGNLTALFERSATRSPDRLRLGFQAPRLAARREQAREGGPFIEKLAGEQLFNAVDLKGEMSLGAGELRAERVEAPSLTWLEVPGVELAGAAHGDFSVERSDTGALRGQARVMLNDGRLEQASFGARADLTCSVGATRAAEAGAPWHFERLRLAASQAQLRSGQKQSKPFDARVDASGMRVTGSSPPSLQGGVQLHVSSTEALLPLFVTETVQDLGTALVDLRGLDARARLKVEAGGVEVTGIDARDGQLRLRGSVSKHGKHPNGAVLVSSGPLNVGVSFARGDTDISPLVADDWLVSTRRD